MGKLEPGITAAQLPASWFTVIPATSKKSASHYKKERWYSRKRDGLYH